MPHNSVDADPDGEEMSGLNINRASAQAFDRVVGVLRDRVLSLALSRNDEETLEEASAGTEAMMETIVIEDDSEEEEDQTVFTDSRDFIDVTGDTLEETIDLTEDSPARQVTPPQDVEEASESALDTTMAMASSLKCPICLESFKDLSKGGKNKI